MRDARHYGRSNVRSKGTCTNILKVKRADLERLIGDAIRHRWMTKDAMARLRADIVAERERSLGTSDEEKIKVQAALQRKQDQVTRIVSAIADAGHNPALLARLDQLEGETEALLGELKALTAADHPCPDRDARRH